MIYRVGIYVNRVVLHLVIYLIRHCCGFRLRKVAGTSCQWNDYGTIGAGSTRMYMRSCDRVICFEIINVYLIIKCLWM